MRLYSDSIGRKVLMAISGLLMVLFVVGHLLGNLTIFFGQDGINAYAMHLHELAPVVWITRVVMLAAVLTHLFLSIQVTMENSAAKPEKYAVRTRLRATFASETMIWTGVVIGAFIVFHLFHFTIRPGMTLGTDAMDRPDVFSMVVDGLSKTLTASAYVIAMVSLALHLSHGIQSSFQTLGVSNGRWMPRFGAAGKAAATAFLVGFGAIPVAILAGFLSTK